LKENSFEEGYHLLFRGLTQSLDSGITNRKVVDGGVGLECGIEYISFGVVQRKI
jgi:hypothetical protein